MSRNESFNCGFYSGNGALQELTVMINSESSSAETIEKDPLTTRLQSPENGKTNIVLQEVQKGVSSIYWCLKRSNREDHPRPESFIAEKLKILVENTSLPHLFDGPLSCSNTILEMQAESIKQNQDHLFYQEFRVVDNGLQKQRPREISRGSGCGKIEAMHFSKHLLFYSCFGLVVDILQRHQPEPQTWMRLDLWGFEEFFFLDFCSSNDLQRQTSLTDYYKFLKRQIAQKIEDGLYQKVQELTELLFQRQPISNRDYLQQLDIQKRLEEILFQKDERSNEELKSEVEATNPSDWVSKKLPKNFPVLTLAMLIIEEGFLLQSLSSFSSDKIREEEELEDFRMWICASLK